MGQHKRFYDVSVHENDAGKILKLPTQFEFANGEYVKPQRALETIEEMGIAFLEKVRLMEDGEDGALTHHVGGAAVGGMRDIQRSQNNPDLRIVSGDFAVIRNERSPGSSAKFYPFQVAKVITVYTNSSDYITEILVHECGGDPVRGSLDPCDKKTSYKPRYMGIDPINGLERDLFIEGNAQRKPWQLAQQFTIDPLTIVEWGRKDQMLTIPCKLRASVLTTIHHQPRVEWVLPAKELVKVPVGGGPKRRLPEKELVKVPVSSKKKKKTVWC